MTTSWKFNTFSEFRPVLFIPQFCGVGKHHAAAESAHLTAVFAKPVVLQKPINNTLSAWHAITCHSFTLSSE
jgi:hypothetical protein